MKVLLAKIYLIGIAVSIVAFIVYDAFVNKGGFSGFLFGIMVILLFCFSLQAAVETITKDKP